MWYVSWVQGWVYVFYSLQFCIQYHAEIILCMRPANERWRYNVVLGAYTKRPCHAMICNVIMTPFCIVNISHCRMLSPRNHLASFLVFSIFTPYFGENILLERLLQIWWHRMRWRILTFLILLFLWIDVLSSSLMFLFLFSNTITKYYLWWANLSFMSKYTWFFLSFWYKCFQYNGIFVWLFNKIEWDQPRGSTCCRWHKKYQNRKIYHGMLT